MRDLRKYAKQTNNRLLAGGLLLVLFVGIGLIYAFYGPRSAVIGLVCLGAAFVPVILVVISLWAIEKIVKKANEDE